MYEKMTLGQMVRSRRLALGLRQQDLAERLGVDQTWISSIERGLRRTLPSPEEMLMLAEALQTTTEELMRDLGYLPPDRRAPEMSEDAALFTSIARELEQSGLPQHVKDVFHADMEWARERIKIEAQAKRRSVSS